MFAQFLTFAARRPHLKLGRVHIVSDVSLIRRILATDAFGKGDLWDELRPLLGSGLLTSFGEEWKAQRIRLGGTLNAASVGSMADTIDRIVTDETDAILRIRGPFNVAARMLRISERITQACLFGFDGASIYQPICQVLNHIYRSLARRAVLGSSSPLPEQTRRALAVVNDFVMTLPTPPHAQGLSGAALRDELVTLYVAGVETTASALTWMVLSGLSPHDALLRYPPIYFLPRDVLADCSLDGIAFRRGHMVVLNLIGAQRKEGQSMSFGSGPRKCVGERLALAEMRAVYDALAGRIKPHASANLSPALALTLWPKNPIGICH